MLIVYIDMLCYCKVCIMRFVLLCRIRHTHTEIANRELSSRRMGMRGRSRAAEAQTKNEDQPQLTIVAEISELRQVV